MPFLVADIIREIETLFPLSFQESYDNCGLQIGSYSTEVSGVMVAVETTKQVLQECLESGCNMLITHHPLLFKGLKRISDTSYIERCVTFAIQHQIVIYALHTAIDNSLLGNNLYMADKVGMRKEDRQPLIPLASSFYKLQVFVPCTHEAIVREALTQAGAGAMGNYDSCTFSHQGVGRFRPLDGANPFIGQVGKRDEEAVEEICISTIVERHCLGQVKRALHTHHPYETPAYDIIELRNESLTRGAGIVGDLESPVSESHFLQQIKDRFGLASLSYSHPIGRTVQKVAICGGSGGSMLSQAIRQGADALITGEVKYNDYLDAFGAKILLVCIGHFESESCFKERMIDFLSSKFPNFVIRMSYQDISPVNYLN